MTFLPQYAEEFNKVCLLTGWGNLKNNGLMQLLLKKK